MKSILEEFEHQVAQNQMGIPRKCWNCEGATPEDCADCNTFIPDEEEDGYFFVEEEEEGYPFLDEEEEDPNDTMAALAGYTENPGDPLYMP